MKTYTSRNCAFIGRLRSNFYKSPPFWGRVLARLRSPMWRQQAEAEGLTLLEADNKTGYFGVGLTSPGYTKPYKAQVSRGGKVW